MPLARTFRSVNQKNALTSPRRPVLAGRRYCYPLTITDLASRYLFACEALTTAKEAYAFPVFEAVFKEFGLPKAIRTDNGIKCNLGVQNGPLSIGRSGRI